MVKRQTIRLQRPLGCATPPPVPAKRLRCRRSAREESSRFRRDFDLKLTKPSPDDLGAVGLLNAPREKKRGGMPATASGVHSLQSDSTGKNRYKWRIPRIPREISEEILYSVDCVPEKEGFESA